MKKTKAKIRKILMIFITLILIIGGAIIVDASIFDNAVTIGFEDKALYEKVKLELDSKGIKKIQLNKDDETIGELEIKLEDDDLKSITSLDLQGISGSQINNLSGIESFTNLEELNLSGNTITNIETLNQLKESLKILDISRNDLSTGNEKVLNIISELTNLTTLNMSNTKLDNINIIATLNKLETLILSGNTINDFTPISGFTSITTLDISNNSAFVAIGLIDSLTGIKKLNISNTSITNLLGIDSLEQLEELYASNITGLQSDQDRLASLYLADEEENPYLKNLRVLDLSNSGITETTDSEGNVIRYPNQVSIDFYKLAKITTLEELYLENMGIYSLSGLINLTKLNVLDLANNKITSSALEELIIKENDEVQEDNVLKATKIELQDNNIIDVSMFADYPADIKYLDLSRNHIYDTTPLKKHSFSEKLYLKEQDIIFNIYDKAVEVNHYIILPEIFKSNKIENSLVYSEDNYTMVGLELNKDYTDPNEYNVIIDSAKTQEDILSITINGGNADGTILTYIIGYASESHNGYLIESLYFNDANLYNAMISEIENDPQNQGYEYYREESLKIIPQKIINIDRNAIDLMRLLYFDNKSIQDLTGMENCSAIEELYLQGNNISTIQPLEACTQMRNLKLANNKNIRDNNSAIEKMTNQLTYLDLSNTGMTNINSINNLIGNAIGYQLYELNISQNSLENIDGIENINSLAKLGIADNQLDNEDLDVVENLTGLTTLDISGNQISDISPISNLSSLTHLYFDNNKVENIETLRGKKFTELSFRENKIKDITPLSSHTSINKLYIDSNQIEDVSVLDDISITGEFSATGQKIAKTFSEEATGEILIELPQIFKSAKTSGSKVYTSNELGFSNCELDSAGENLIINVDEVSTEAAQVNIYKGNANGTTLTITMPLTSTIQYSPSSDAPTNQNVTATITFNRTATITNNEGENTYEFTDNGEFTFEYEDEYGFTGTKTAKVTNIDKVAPTVEVSKEIVEQKVVVTIQANETITLPDGWEWTSSENQLTIIRTYAEDANEKVNITDLAGNKTEVNIEVKINISDKIISQEYIVNEEKLMINKIEEETTVAVLKNKLQNEMEYAILDNSGNQVSDAQIIGTGYQIKMANGKIYALVVTGDINGDGKVKLSDLSKLKMNLVGKVTLDTVYKEAADLNGDGQIKLSDLSKLKIELISK